MFSYAAWKSVKDVTTDVQIVVQLGIEDSSSAELEVSWW